MLFEGFDKDVMVMQRDEQEVFDNAIHVFFDKEYYDSYVSKATKYGKHSYAYHEDKLGEVVNQVFEENIEGIAFHISASDNLPKNTLCDEKYISQKEMLGLKDVADSYHYLYTTAIERRTKEETVAHLWTKNVYIIGSLPDFRVKPQEGEKPVFELMTQRRKKDGGTVTEDDYDYESLKVFLTSESAMRFNPDKKPVSKYKLGLLSQILKGKLQILIEPHRNYWLEYDPANIDISEYFKAPQLDEEKVKARIREYTKMEKVYILLSPQHSDYKECVGNPFLMNPDGNNIIMYLFEKYEDAVSYILQNPNFFPIFDSTYPIGVLDKNEKYTNLNTIIAIAKKIGVSVINLDMDTMKTIGCKFEFFEKVSGYDLELENILESDVLKNVVAEKDGEKHYRFPIISFCDNSNKFAVSEERKAEIISHMDSDFDNGLVYLSGCTIPEMLVFMKEAATRFDKARKEENEENKQLYNSIMNKVTVPITEALCEEPYIYTLRNEDGSFALKNNIPYLIITNRYEAARKGEGKLTPVGVDNEQFMDKLLETGNIVAVTDGPGIVSLADIRLMADIAKQWKKSESIRQELMIYLTQGCDLSYTEADYYYKRLKADSSIFVEFTSTVRNGEYPPMGMITVDGHNAKDIADKEGLNFLQAYDSLLSLKEKANTTKTAEDNQNDNDEKKGLFGKLFKK